MPTLQSGALVYIEAGIGNSYDMMIAVRGTPWMTPSILSSSRLLKRSLSEFSPYETGRSPG